MFKDEYRDGKSSRREYCCRICDKPLESFELVCDECQKRDDDFVELDTYLEFLENEDAAYRRSMKEKEVVAATPQAALKKVQEQRGGTTKYRRLYVDGMIRA